MGMEAIAPIRASNSCWVSSVLPRTVYGTNTFVTVPVGRVTGKFIPCTICPRLFCWVVSLPAWTLTPGGSVIWVLFSSLISVGLGSRVARCLLLR